MSTFPSSSIQYASTSLETPSRSREFLQHCAGAGLCSCRNSRVCLGSVGPDVMLFDSVFYRITDPAGNLSARELILSPALNTERMCTGVTELPLVREGSSSFLPREGLRSIFLPLVSLDELPIGCPPPV